MLLYSAKIKSPVWQGIFCPELVFSADFPTVSVHLPGAVTGITFVCTSKSQTLAAVPQFGHTKILHTLIGMGSAALVAAVSKAA